MLSARGVLLALTLVAAVAGWTLSRAHDAQARAHLLAGTPRVDTVRALAPRRGRDAGRLVVWARVDHAPGTARALARERPETVHRARVVARVGGVSRFATQQLELGRRRRAGGYFFRFPRALARVAQAGADPRVSVAVRVTQTVDLDSDGDSDERAHAATTRRVPLARPAVSIEPPDGEFANGAGDRLQVSRGAVISFSFFNRTCAAPGPAHNVSAPIDPQTGEFRFFASNAANPGSPAPVTTTASGAFIDATSVALEATVAFETCVYVIKPPNFSWLRT